MSARKWAGAYPSNSKDLVTVGYVQDKIDVTNLDQPTVDAMIAQGFAPYADKTYADTKAALNATASYIDTGDNTRLHRANINQPNGIAGLGAASAKVDRARLGLASTQRWPLGYSSPASYNASTVAAGLTEQTIYTWTVDDPGYDYKLLVSGIVDGMTDRDTYFPIILIRVGSNTGPIIAMGYGCTERYSAATVSQFTTPGAFVYTIPVWANTIDILLLGGGGGGASGAGNPFIWGNGGGAASWQTVTVTVGSLALPIGVTQINGVVGGSGGGAPGGVFSNNGGTGGTTSVTYHTSTLASYGAGGGSGNLGTQAGANAGSVSVGGYTYFNGGYGNGGAGGPGGFFIGNPGQPGGSGSAWFVAHPLSADFNAGPINVLPGSLSYQDVLTGDTDLFVQLVRVIGDNTGTGSAYATNFKPGMCAVPIPA